MQIPENQFQLNEMYQRAAEDVVNTKTLKSKTLTELLDMKQIFGAYHESQKMFSTAAPYLALVEEEISKRESSKNNLVAVVIAIVALIVSVLAWLFPRSPAEPEPQRGQGVGLTQSNDPYTAMPQTNAAQAPPVLSTGLQSSSNRASENSH